VEYHRDLFSPTIVHCSINDLEEGTECKVSKFVDDTKIAGRTCCDGDIVILRWDIDRLSDWMKTWQMEFNVKV